MLGSCGARQLLPQDSDLCADIFTACLTTPIKAAMRWFCSRTSMGHDGITKELIDRIPGASTSFTLTYASSSKSSCRLGNVSVDLD